MEVLVAGATGMTGMALVEQLLDNGHNVRAIVRSPGKFSPKISNHPNLNIIEATILDLSEEDLCYHTRGCDAVVSCLGHVLNFKGMFAHPRKLCTEATRRLCEAMEATGGTSKFILMNSVGVANPQNHEKRTVLDRCVLSILRYTLPPHRDNETAAQYLYGEVGRSNNNVEWCIVRPDTLINAEVSEYEIVKSPATSIFIGRPTSRSNVAHFMKSLIENDTLWNEWKFKAPVIMNG